MTAHQKAQTVPANKQTAPAKKKPGGAGTLVDPGAHIVFSASQLSGCSEIGVMPSPDVDRLQLRVVGANASVHVAAASDEADPPTPLGVTFTSASCVTIELFADGVSPDVWQRLVLTGIRGASAVIIHGAHRKTPGLSRMPIIAQKIGQAADVTEDVDQTEVVEGFLEHGSDVFGNLAVGEAAQMQGGTEHERLVTDLIDGLSHVTDRDTTLLGVKLLITSGKR